MPNDAESLISRQTALSGGSFLEYYYLFSSLNDYAAAEKRAEQEITEVNQVFASIELLEKDKKILEKAILILDNSIENGFQPMSRMKGDLPFNIDMDLLQQKLTPQEVSSLRRLEKYLASVKRSPAPVWPTLEAARSEWKILDSLTSNLEKLREIKETLLSRKRLDEKMHYNLKYICDFFLKKPYGDAQ